jgi:hypothetical protein
LALGVSPNHQTRLNTSSDKHSSLFDTCEEEVEETIPRLLLSGSNFSNCQNAEIRLPGYLELSSTNSDIKKHGRCPGQNVIKLCRWLVGSIYDRLIRLLHFWQDPAQVELFVLITIMRLGRKFFSSKNVLACLKSIYILVNFLQLRREPTQVGNL